MNPPHPTTQERSPMTQPTPTNRRSAANDFDFLIGHRSNGV
jgi:hypothetical protein